MIDSEYGEFGGKPHIVYFTSGEFSAYGVQHVYVGDHDPMRHINKLTNARSAGRWPTMQAMNEDRGVDYGSDSLKRQIRSEYVILLEEWKFVKVEAKEIWLG